MPSSDPQVDAAANESAPPPGTGAPASASSPRPSGKHRIRRRLILLAMVVVVVVAGLGYAGWQLLNPGTQTTIWQNIAAGITDGKVPTQTALEAFAYLYDVSIPGVTVPGGIDGSDAPQDGSGPLSWVQANWSSLTPAQQAVIKPFTGPGPGDQTIPIGVSPSPQALGPSRPGGPALYDPISPSAAANAAAEPAAPADITTAMTNELIRDVAHIGPKLGMAVIPPGSWPFPNIELTLSNLSGGKTLFETWADEEYGQYMPCHMIAYKEAWQGEKPTKSGGVSDRLHVLITHEVVHCYQNVIWGSNAVHFTIPPWITEGTALYLAADDTKIAEVILPSMWQLHYFLPEIPLTTRSYDGFGYYALLAHAGRDLWGTMKAAWQAAAFAPGPNRSDPFIAVLHGDDPDIRNNWAESYLRKNSWGDPWIAYGFDIPASAQVNQHPAQAHLAPGWNGSLQSRANTVLNVTNSDGEVVLITTDGLVSIHDDAGHSAIAVTSAKYCTVSSCVCPKGTKLAGQDMAPDRIYLPFVTAFNAPEGGSKYTIMAETLAELCGQQLTPYPTYTAGQPSVPCGVGCAESNGDPHMWTVGEEGYDFQAAGEFTLLRSPDGSVDVQGRQEPYGDGENVSINTAVAARVGSHRVGVYLDQNAVIGNGLTVRVDGQAVDPSKGPIDLGGGQSLSAVSDGYAVNLTDGSVLYALGLNGYGIDVLVQPSKALRADGVGLLAAIDDTKSDLPPMPDGSQLPIPQDSHTAYVETYQQFADAWRVTDSTTLFDYDSGKSTATYTIESFPSEPKVVTLKDLTPSQLAAGQAACASVTTQPLHDNCVVDVGVTGEAGFGMGYGLIQTFENTPIVLSTLPPFTGPPPTSPPTLVNGAATVTAGSQIGGYAVGPDDTVYLSVHTGDNAYQLVSFDPKTSKVLQSVSVPALTEVHFAAGSLWLPGLVTDSHASNCSVSRFDPATLTQQATIPIPCADALGPSIGSDGQQIWYEDDSNGKPFAVALDPTTGQPGTKVKMPSHGGYFIDSQGAIFYTNPDNNGFFRLTSGGSSFDSLGTFQNVAIPAGTGLWVQAGQGKPARYYTQSGTPDKTVQVKGVVVAADANAVYTEQETKTAQGGTRPELWRYPADGSAPASLAVPPVVNSNPQSFQDDPPPTVTGDAFVKLWAVRTDTPQATIILEFVPLAH